MNIRRRGRGQRAAWRIAERARSTSGRRAGDVTAGTLPKGEERSGDGPRLRRAPIAPTLVPPVRKLLIGVGVVLWTVTGSGVIPARMATAAPTTRLEVLHVPATASAVRAAAADGDGTGVSTPYPLSHAGLESG